MESTNRQVSVIIDLTDGALNANPWATGPLIAGSPADQQPGDYPAAGPDTCQQQWIGVQDLVNELHDTVAPQHTSAPASSRSVANTSLPQESVGSTVAENAPKLGFLHPVRWWRAIKGWLAACDQALIDGGSRAY